MFFVLVFDTNTKNMCSVIWNLVRHVAWYTVRHKRPIMVITFVFCWQNFVAVVSLCFMQKIKSYGWSTFAINIDGYSIIWIIMISRLEPRKPLTLHSICMYVYKAYRLYFSLKCWFYLLRKFWINLSRIVISSLFIYNEQYTCYYLKRSFTSVFYYYRIFIIGTCIYRQ